MGGFEYDLQRLMNGLAQACGVLLWHIREVDVIALGGCGSNATQLGNHAP